jgi:hypothetical protein
MLQSLNTLKPTRPNETICINFLAKKNHNEQDKILLLKEIAFGYMRFFNYP